MVPCIRKKIKYVDISFHNCINSAHYTAGRIAIIIIVIYREIKVNNLYWQSCLCNCQKFDEAIKLKLTLHYTIPPSIIVE
jgi:hypothetical protein